MGICTWRRVDEKLASCWIQQDEEVGVHYERQQLVTRIQLGMYSCGGGEWRQVGATLDGEKSATGDVFADRGAEMEVRLNRRTTRREERGRMFNRWRARATFGTGTS